MHNLRAVCRGVSLLALLVLAGCGDADSMAEVTGTVRVDGEPMSEGSITLVPANGDGPTAGGQIKDGKYSVRSPKGVMKVSISMPKVVGKKKVYATPDSPEMPVTVEALPPRFNQATELRLEVKGGSNPKDWDLQSK
jgi:hypothetical protein